MIWTQDASREVKFVFRLRRATKNTSRQVKICVSPARNAQADLGWIVFPVQGHKKRVSGGQNLRFVSKNASRQVKMCVSPARNSKEDLDRRVFPAQGHKKRAGC